ncbi:hypothetical protein [Nocardioides litoris]|uniref:hypothetical protein n=1 Tax=Nocardioides litoris TaxID=1926648 RepID=UPI00111E259A|nr:hypothetical protein [Nocardioides litoris]
MDEKTLTPTTSPTASLTTSLTAGPTATVDRRLEQRAALKNRHSQGVVKLMGKRDDLRGVHALADFVDESVRWTA